MNERSQMGFEDLLETCLHGQSPLERDEARTQLIAIQTRLAFVFCYVSRCLSALVGVERCDYWVI